MSDNISELDLTIPPSSGSVLVEAGAGTGKTFSIAILFLWEVIVKYRSVDSILVVTFTEAATSELKERIRNFLMLARDILSGSSKNEPAAIYIRTICEYNADEKEKERRMLIVAQAIYNFDDVSIFTIHGFCQRMLSENAFETGSPFATGLLDNEDDVVRQIVDDYYRSYIYRQDISSYSALVDSNVSVNRLTKWTLQYIKQNDIVITPETEVDITNSFVDKEMIELIEDITECALVLRETAIECRAEIESFFNVDNKFKVAYTMKLVVENLDLCIKFDPNTISFDKGAKKAVQFFSPVKIKSKGLKKAFIDEPVSHFFFEMSETLLSKIEKYEAKMEEIPLRVTALYHDLFAYTKKRLSEYKSERHLISYNDMLANLDAALTGMTDLAARIRTRYRSVFIDEFQDTDPLQYRIFSTIFKEADVPLYFIGDPKQAIYSFRGADLNTYLEAAKACSKTYSLTTNYRSTEDVLSPINRLFSGKAPFIEEGIVYADAQTAGQPQEREVIDDGQTNFIIPLINDMNSGGTQSLIAEHVAMEIEKILKLSADGKTCLTDSNSKQPRSIRPSDIAVLVRTSTQGSIVANAIRERGITAIEISPDSVYRSHEFFEMELLLFSLADPYSSSKLFALLSTRICSFSASKIDSLHIGESEEYNDLLLAIRNYAELWREKGFHAAVLAIFDDFKTYESVLGLEGGERIITNYMHIIELFHDYCLKTGAGPDELLFHIQLIKRGDTGENETEVPVRMESDEQAVIISTIHKSKGLEYPIVFVPYCWKNSAPLSGSPFTFHRNGKRYLDISASSKSDNYATCCNEILSENIRLLYVALTRARSRVYLYWGEIKNRNRNFYSSALDYLLFRDCVSDIEDVVMNLRSNLEEEKPSVYNRVKDYFKGYAVTAYNVIEVPAESDYIPVERTCNFSSREFTRSIDNSWKINSYSYITSGIRNEGQHERHYQSGNPVPDDMLPPGAAAGNCFHAILEQIAFIQPVSDYDELIEDQLRMHGFNKTYKDYVSRCIDSVLKAPLQKNFSLSLLTDRDRIHEMEFYFPIESVKLQNLISVVNSYYPEFHSTENTLFSSELKGYMKGFIDLVFQKEGKLYIADWKSNYLSGSYEENAITDSMKMHNYHIQLVIYSIALWRYIRSRTGTYNYQVFGGVYYFYVRGMETDSQNGVYFNRPQQKFLEEANSCFL
ncbi:MAG: exodeoxyribonuclease V subunit beta [Spirochaetes bacterium]|jgi:exodeoxyribonuclease V beta subunit|nr:exodeoxyribonuclease V subunit beta [Spirochaetota bacterium]